MGPKSIKFVFFNHDASCIIYNVSFSSFIPMFAEFWVNSGNSPRHLASKCLIGPPVAFKRCHCCKHRGSYLQALDGAGWDSIGMSMMSLPATVYYILLCHVNIGRSPITVNPKRKGENMWNHHAFSVVCSWNWWQGQCCTFRSSVKRYIDPIWSHEVSVQGKYCHTSSHKRVDQNRFVPVSYFCQPHEAYLRVTHLLQDDDLALKCFQVLLTWTPRSQSSKYEQRQESSESTSTPCLRARPSSLKYIQTWDFSGAMIAKRMGEGKKSLPRPSQNAKKIQKERMEQGNESENSLGIKPEFQH